MPPGPRVCLALGHPQDLFQIDSKALSFKSFSGGMPIPQPLPRFGKPNLL